MNLNPDGGAGVPVIAITGIGLVSPIGDTPEAMVQAILSAKSGIKPLSGLRFVVGGRARVGLADVSKTDVSRFLGKGELDRCTVLSLAACTSALNDSGVVPATTVPGEKVGLVLGTCNGGMLSLEKFYRRILGLEAFEPTLEFMLQKTYYGAAVTTAAEFGLKGPCVTVTTACSSSSNAIGLACDLIVSGKVDCMLAGGADAFSETTLAGFEMLKTVCGDECAPFSTPYGLNLGEGAAYWVLETEDHALARGAKVYGYVLGYGLSADAHHATAPHPKGEGLVAALQMAVEASGLAVSDIDYVNAHGTGTEANDKSETKALRSFFKDGVPPVSSLKSYMGHTLGAAGILEATAALLSLTEGVLPPTLRFKEPRPGCDLDYVPNEPRQTSASVFVSEKAAFGGHNAAIVVCTPKSRHEQRGMPGLAGEKVLITGIGLVSSLGWGVVPHLEKLAALGILNGHDGNRVSKRFHTQDTTKAVERRLGLAWADHGSRASGAAVHQALKSAGLKPGRDLCRNLGLVVGLAAGPARAEKEYFTGLFMGKGGGPSQFPYLVPNSIAGNVSRSLGLKGFGTTVCSGLGSGLQALWVAVESIRNKRTSAILAGGVDEAGEALEESLRLEAKLAGCEIPPGLGEGAAFMLLESEANARNRDARVLATVLEAVSAFEPGLAKGDSSLAQALENLLSRMELDGQKVDRVCLAPILGNKDDVEAVQTIVGSLSDEVISMDRVTGTLQSAGALVALGCSLAMGPGLTLCVACSPHGVTTGVMLEVAGDAK